MRTLLSYWSFDIISISFIVLLCLLYGYIIRFKWHKQSVYFFAGIALLIVCVASPLHYLGEHYLFSAHMLTHTLLLLMVAPLLIAGIPKENKLKNTFIFFSKKISRYPFLCWLMGVGVMWLWHVPAIYNQLFVVHSAMAMPSIHHMNVLSYIHMLSLLIAGMVFCLPVINPYSAYRLTPLFGVLYLTSACIGCSLLGLFITFAPAGTYTHYISMSESNNILSLIRNNWHISAAADQQAGGLIMWVPCCFIYLSAAMLLLLKWFDAKEEAPSISHAVPILE